MSWKERAKELAFGGRVKVPHCATDASAYVSNTPKGISLYCFRCKTREFEPHENMTPAYFLEKRKALKEASKRAPDTIELTDADTPPEARVWVASAGINPYSAKRYGIGYAESLGRVVIPFLHNGEDTGAWQARALRGERPKYFMPKHSKGAFWWQDNGGPVVFVEDVLSAIRVNEAGASVIAVSGTSIPKAVLPLLTGRGIIGWFDGDKAGDAAFVKLNRFCGLLGVKPRKVRTDKDPKKYTKAEIKKHAHIGV